VSRAWNSPITGPAPTPPIRTWGCLSVIERLPALYPGVYGADGFFDAVSPATGAVGHRYLVLDQSMIMAALDNALNNRAIQRDFARDPVSWAARTYLSLEHMSI
jgi:hypothetical protein